MCGALVIEKCPSGFADPRLTTWLCRLEGFAGRRVIAHLQAGIQPRRVAKTLALQGRGAWRNVRRFLGVRSAATTLCAAGVSPIHGVTGLTLSVGSRLGPYEILAPLGAGGMG